MNLRQRVEQLEHWLTPDIPLIVILDEDTADIRVAVEKRLRGQGHSCIVFGNKCDERL